MRVAKFNKSLTIAISEDAYREIKKITDARKISLAEWFREAAEKALTESNQKDDVSGFKGLGNKF